MRRLACAIVTAAAMTACVPTLDGPQLVDPPPGLGYVAPRDDPHGKLGSHEAILERAWVSMADGRASVTVVAYRGRATRAEAEEWLASQPASGAERSAISTARIDGHDAWTWTDRSAGWIGVGAVVPYPDETYAIRLSSSRPAEQDEARLRAAVLSFRREPGAALRWAVPLGVAAIVALAVGVRRMRKQEPPPRVVPRPKAPPAPGTGAPASSGLPPRA